MPNLLANALAQANPLFFIFFISCKLFKDSLDTEMQARSRSVPASLHTVNASLLSLSPCDKLSEQCCEISRRNNARKGARGSKGGGAGLDGWTGGGLTERSQSLLLINHCSVSDLSFAKGAKKRGWGVEGRRRRRRQGRVAAATAQPCGGRDDGK